MPSAHKIEKIVFVNQDGTPTGETAEKLSAHNANTKLHLAFSCYIFDNSGMVLVTQRAKGKKVWPSVWTNSVCGHPGPNEDMLEAIQRRAKYELGISDITNIKIILPKYKYKTPLFKGVVENEFCPVYFAKTSQQPVINKQEVDDFKWMSWEDIKLQLHNDADDTWSYWIKDQFKNISQDMLENFTF